MEYFTSDWHLGEKRIGINGELNLFYRPFDSIEEQNETIVNNFNEDFKDGDTLWHLGDVINGDLKDAENILYNLKYKYPNSKFNLVMGNYDVDKQQLLSKYFDTMVNDYLYLDFNDTDNVYMNHYPTNCIDVINSDNEETDLSFGITGHIHGLWKVQRNLINVGVDAWHFKLVSKEEIEFCWNSMKNHYDSDVFPY